MARPGTSVLLPIRVLRDLEPRREWCGGTPAPSLVPAPAAITTPLLRHWTACAASQWHGRFHQRCGAFGRHRSCPRRAWSVIEWETRTCDKFNAGQVGYAGTDGRERRCHCQGTAPTLARRRPGVALGAGADRRQSVVDEMVSPLILCCCGGMLLLDP